MTKQYDLPAAEAQLRKAQTHPQASRFICLDALRGLGAIIVVYAHYHFELWPDRPGIIVNAPAYLVVDVFFLLSGFVLAHALYDKPSFNFWDFTKKRAFRLWPMHLVFLLCFVVLMYLSGDPIHEEGLLLNLLLLHNVGIGDWETNSFNFPSWSLSVELVINLAVGLIIMLIPNRRWSSLLLAALSIASATALFFSVENLNVQIDNVYGGLNTGLLRGFMTFPLGILAYRFFNAHKAWFERTSLLRTVFTGLAIVAFFMSLFIPIPYKADFLYLGFYTAFILILAGPGAFWKKYAVHLRFLGNISFAVYLGHMIILKIMKETGFWPHDYLQGFLFALTLSIILATFVHYKVEKPSYAWLTRRYCKPERAKSADTYGKTQPAQ